MVLGVVLAFAGRVEAHGIEQLRGEMDVEPPHWKATIWVGAWMLYPQEGPHAPTGKPGEPGAAGRAWMATLTDKEHADLRQQADDFFHSYFWISLGETPLEFHCEFPDYAPGAPPFEENAEGNALLKVELRGELPAGASGPLNLHWDDLDDILVLQVRHGSAKPAVFRLEAATPSAELLQLSATGETKTQQGSTLLTWIHAGFTHILPKGLDHILFIVGLFLLQPKLRPLLWQTSAFTLAHSITLALVVLGLLSVPARVVEPLIAASIAYVGIENLWVRKLKPWRIALIFGLGLLHGMGFASVMKELQLPEGEVLKPLVGFNLGVEFGQLSVLVMALALSAATYGTLCGWRRADPSAQMEVLRKVASAGIGIVGLWWTFERIFL